MEVSSYTLLLKKLDGKYDFTLPGLFLFKKVKVFVNVFYVFN